MKGGALHFRRISLRAPPLRDANLMRKEKTNANYPSHNTGALVDRSSAGVALQQRLGILSERWLGVDPADRAVGRCAPVTKLFLIASCGSQCGGNGRLDLFRRVPRPACVSVRMNSETADGTTRKGTFNEKKHGHD